MSKGYSNTPAQFLPGFDPDEKKKRKKGIFSKLRERIQLKGEIKNLPYKQKLAYEHAKMKKTKMLK